ncbi:MAG: hypothetical protein ACKVXR_03290 [Planctomycetota bacterium]
METKPRTRVVLLGASNLTLAFPLVVGELRSRLRAPIDLVAALGHGRSYGTSSTVLFRELPGIDECGLWSTLEQADSPDTLALLTDLGNDIAYGREVAEITAWIERCLARLAAAGARTTLVRMPIEVMEEIGELRFKVAKGIIFPGRKIDLETVRTRVRTLDRDVLAIARDRSLTVVEQPASWFGLDPIHILRSRREQAWRTILTALVPGKDPVPHRRLSWADRRILRHARPQWRRHFGREQRRGQPSAELLDGTTISLY